MIVERQTLAAEVRIEGIGLHGAEPVTLTLHPAENGIWFRRGSWRAQAVPEEVTDTARCTRLGEVSTIEHLMSALCGLGITDVEIEVEGPELPGLDGSALPYVHALLGVGFVSLPSRELPALFSRVFVQEDNLKIAIAKGSGHWRYVYEIDNRYPGRQEFETEQVLADYASEIAPARTFALAEELPMIIEHGLGKGLSEASCLILGIEGTKNDARFDDEPARHKLLDLMGDLYLAGVPASHLSVVAERSGHRSNVKAAALLRKALSS